MAPGKFQHSFALFDAEGRLIDWDEGYAREWRISGPPLKSGITYAEILKTALNAPQAREFLAANYKSASPEEVIQAQIKGFATNRSHEYRSPAGIFIRVDEERTVSGGVRRLARDITEEKEAGDALEAQQRLEEADSDAGGVLTETRRNPDGSYVFPRISEGLRRMLNLPADMVGQDPMMIYSRMIRTEEDDIQQAFLMERSAQTMEICTMEYRVRDGKDRIRWIRQSMMPRREANGVVIFSGVMRDVTREKDAEDQLEMLRSVVVRSTDSIAIFESDSTPERNSRIIYVNARFTELFGRTAEELVGHPIEQLEPNRLDMEGAAMMTAALLRNDGEPIEFQSRGKGGRIFWVEARIATIQRFENGNFRWVVISRDVSERRQVQQQLLRAKEEAEAGNRAKSNFLANMSHELRTPLNAIIGFTELIDQGVQRTGWNPSYREYLADVGESGRHLLELINTILDLSKIEAGSLHLNPGPVDVCDLIEISIALVSSLARNGNITLSADLPPGRPEIPGDFLKLKQVLLNVYSNAIKFTPSGGQITTQVLLTPDQALITVSDTGCGISEADLKRVTLPFVQVETALSRKHSGSGLGLSIARELCKLHGGRLTIESVEGQGTTVQIVLPRQISPPS
ncbi:MAG: domain S-box protein [Rhodospirillales bacterium]|nr:domain S-box protein [Rhodospirillales bacterium]